MFNNKMPKATSDIYAKKYTDVMETNNYKLFKFFDGNRPIRKPHLKNIHDSIAVKQIAVPIVVDEHYRICDGQNRFTACEMLKKPVYYITIPGLTLEDVQRLNANTKTWQTDDFMDSYCELGLADYIKYRDFKKKYKFGHTECMIILGGWANEGKRIHQNFREGSFTIKDYPNSIKISEKIVQVKKYYDGYSRKSFVNAMLQLFKNEEYNHNIFLDKLSKQTEKMVHQADKESYLRLIEKIYNFRTQTSNKVRLFSF